MPIAQLISFSFAAVIVGNGKMIMLVVSVVSMPQVVSLINTEYKVLILVLANGLLMLGLLTNEAGLHK